MARPYFVDRVIVRSLSAGSTRGRFTFASRDIQCTLGRAGIRRYKREGDGVTPAGTYTMRCVLYRADRLARPCTGLPLHPLHPDDGWCDDPISGRYNRLIRQPFTDGAEDLWRADGLYDAIAILGYNDRPVIRGRGSAIFLHVAAANFAPTAGCVGLRQNDLLRVLAHVDPYTKLVIV